MKHAVMSITTEFELEPVLDDYFQKYPNGQYKGYQVVFRSENEHDEGEFSYLVVFTLNKEGRQSHMRFDDFLDAYCKVNNLVAFVQFMSQILPKYGNCQHILGNRDKLANRKKSSV